MNNQKKYLQYTLITLSLLMLLTLSSCAEPKDQEFTVPPSTEQQLTKAVGEFQKMLGDFLGKETSPTSKASEEIEKLFVFEYRVIDIDRNNPTSVLEQELQKLGEDRWECFHVESEPKAYKVFCKRRPKTYLRLIPRVF